MSAPDAATLLPLLREVAEKAKLEVRRETSAMPAGLCKLKGRWLVVVPSGTPATEEVGFLVEGLKKIDLTGVFVPPAVRDVLE